MKRFIVGLVLGILLGAGTISLADQDAITKFETRSKTIRDAYFKTFTGYSPIHTEVNTAKANLEQLELLSDQLNYIIKQNDSIIQHLKGKGQ